MNENDLNKIKEAYDAWSDLDFVMAVADMNARPPTAKEFEVIMEHYRKLSRSLNVLYDEVLNPI